MNKTLQISFSLKNTYRVNSILYSLKQIPLIKKVLPSTLYSIWGFKIFANIIAGIWEILSIFLGKLVYLAFIIVGVSAMYEGVPQDALFLHIFLFLTVIGAYMNTYLFNPTQDKYYSIILLRMNARELSLLDYGYHMIKLLVGFLPFTIYFGRQFGVPLWLSILIPFSIASLKMVMAYFTLRSYEKTGEASGENQLGKVCLARDRTPVGSRLSAAGFWTGAAASDGGCAARRDPSLWPLESSQDHYVCLL